MGIIHDLRMASGGNRKLEILKANAGNEGWKKVLVAMYDSSINYYTGVPNDNTFVDSFNVDGLINELRTLSSRSLTGNAARDHALYLSRTYGEIARLILGGSLKAGVSVTSINKAYPNLIPTFPVMLAKKDVPVQYPCWGFTKYDGVRVLVRVEQGKAMAYTRAGKMLPITSLCNNMGLQTDGWYDGELVDGDGKQVGRTTITGSINKILKGTSTEIQGYTYCIFDKVSLEEWDNKLSVTSYVTRLSGLHQNFVPVPNIEPIAPETVDGVEQADEYYKDLRDRGYEGAILRNKEDVYEWRRSPLLIKLKAQKSCVLKCVDVVEGNGKYEGMIGALVCEGVVEDKQVHVKLGTGLSDFDREQMPETYIDQRIDAEYNDVVMAVDAEFHSLFLPVYKRIKGDYNV